MVWKKTQFVALGDMSELKSDLKIRKAIDVLLDSAVEK